MIFQRLHDLYFRLLENPDPVSGLARVPPYGFTDESISFCLVLSKAGELVDIQDVRDTSEKKPKARRFSVPQPAKRTSGVKPNFLWDKTAYVLGIEGNKDNATAKKIPWVLAEKANAAFKQFHEDLLVNQDDAGLIALRQFLQDWKPQQFSQVLFTLDHVDTNVVFKLDGEVGYIHERPAAKQLWLSLLKPAQKTDGEATDAQGMCLVTGEKAVLSRLHPAIKGVYGGQSSGGSIVSFNAEAYESFGKSQGDNAPVSEQAAFAYTTALNYMLRRENGHCISIGDTSTVFWARAKDTQQEQEAVASFSLSVNPPSDESQNNQVRFTLEKIALGKPFQKIAPEIAGDTRFFVLGLAPNASRLSIRYWLDSTLGELDERIAQHWRDILINPLPWNEGKPPSVWKFLLQLTPRRKTPDGNWQKRDAKKNPPPAQLSGEFFRAVISGTPYPISILTKLLDRIRTDGDINGLRTALIKGVLVRNFSYQLTKEIPMALDKDHPNPAYQLGCQFALFERAQYAALGKLNASVKDKYFGTASANPRIVFASLHRNFNHHVADLRKGKKYEKWKGDPQIFSGWLEKRTGEIYNKLSTRYPAQLSLSEQGLFVLGYYHQRFVPKAKDATLAAALKDESDEIEKVLKADQDTSE